MLRVLAVCCVASVLMFAGCATQTASTPAAAPAAQPTAVAKPAPAAPAASGDSAALAAKVVALEAMIKKMALASGSLPAEKVAPIGVKNDKRNSWKCVKVKKGPKIDGKLDDAVWKKAIQVDLKSSSGKNLMNNTAVLICHDTKNVYIGALCMEIEMEKLKITCTERDQKVYVDDCVEFYIDPELDRTDAVKLVVNPNGVFMDFMRDLDGDAGDVTWNVNMKTTKLEDRYFMEFAIPIRDMGLKYKAGMKIGFNPLRFRGGNGKKWEDSTWVGKCNEIATIGKVTFE